MNSIFKKQPWLRFAFGASFVVLGILTIVLAITNKEGASVTMNVVLAIMLFVLGGLLALFSILNETKVIISGGLVFAAFLISLGVSVIIVQDFVTSLLVTLLAVFLIALGAISIFKAISLIVYKAKWYWSAAMFLLATVGITMGILALLNPETSFIVTFIVVGLGLTAGGIALIVIFFLDKKKRQDEAKIKQKEAEKQARKEQREKAQKEKENKGE